MTSIKLQLPQAHSPVQNLIMKFPSFPAPARELWVANGTKFGKACHILEEIPTIYGFTKMRDICQGDYVFDEAGKPTKVLTATDIMYGHKCYEVVFSDGTKIVVDAEHEWNVKSQVCRKNETRSVVSKYGVETLTTEEISKKVLVEIGGVPRPNYSIDCVTNAVEYLERKLPIDPYLLGVWLGDGSSNNPIYHKPDEEIVMKLILEKGIDVIPQKRIAKKIPGLRKLLIDNNLYMNKHIPPDYLIANPAQRLELLRGLMDTDGTISKTGYCTFDNTNKNLADGVAELVASLGIKCTREERQGKLYGVNKKWCYRVMFITDLPIFTIKRKAERLRPIAEKAKRRSIVAVNEVPSVPVKCITVDSPSHQYLITRSYIPTHNSLAAATGICSRLFFDVQKIYRWVAPIYNQSLIGMRYCSRLLPNEPYVMSDSSLMRLRVPQLENQIQFMHGQNAESLEGEAVAGYIMDEAAKLSEDVYLAAKTTQTFTQGWSVHISTPLGKNWFYKRWAEAKSHMDECLAKGIPPERMAITAPTWSNPHISAQAIADAKRSLPDRLFRQYYAAEFIDDSAIFVGIRNCIYCTTPDEGSRVEKWFAPNCIKKVVCIGVDWAKTSDFTVFSAWEHVNNKMRCVAYMRFQGEKYQVALKYLYRFCAEFNQIAMIYHDKTGIGQVIDDLFEGFPHPVEGVVFTNDRKAELINNFSVGIEQGLIEIPGWRIALEEFDSFEVVVNKLGHMTYSAPNGLHDDCVMSYCLGYYAAHEMYGHPSWEVRSDFSGGDSTNELDSWYSLVEDDDF